MPPASSGKRPRRPQRKTSPPFPKSTVLRTLIGPKPSRPAWSMRAREPGDEAAIAMSSIAASVENGTTGAPAAGPFDDPARQRHAATLGMWIFLTTETLFFGALFFGYAIARVNFPGAFVAASRHTNLVLGTLNTAVLLTSSFFMALAVRAAARRAHRAAARLLVVTALLGAVFVTIKLTEYALDYREHLVPVLDFVFAP